MVKNKRYQNLLDRMLIIENAGEILYAALSSKGKDKKLKLIYERLALNERETAEQIEREILAIDKDRHILPGKTALSLVKIICGVLTARQLAWILKNILKRKIYSGWCSRYKNNNQGLWQLILNHENLQHELLRPFWNN